MSSQKTMQHILHSLLILTLLFTTQGPAMATDASLDALEGTAWVVTALPPDPLLDGITLTLAFEDGRAAGTDGCNRYRGSYTIENGELRIDGLASTMMACPEPVMHQGRRFSSALGNARSATLEDDTLVLLNGDGEPLARLAAQDHSLAGSRWTVTGVNNGRQALVSTSGETDLTLVFDDAGSVTGSAGCNTYRASYSEDDSGLIIGPPAATRRLCDDAVMAQETAFLQALERATQRRIEGDRLELRDDQGAMQVTARRAE